MTYRSKAMVFEAFYISWMPVVNIWMGILSSIIFLGMSQLAQEGEFLPHTYTQGISLILYF